MAIKIKKRNHPKFYVPNYGAKSRSRVKKRWRKQRGIDNKKRVKKRFMGAEPNIGYGNQKEVRGMRASGKRELLIGNLQQLTDALNSKEISGFDITLSAALSRRKKIELTKIAVQKKVNVTNGVDK